MAQSTRIYRTEAVVLKAFDLGEADRILTILTPGRGKLRVSARGVRRTKSRMGGHLDLFTHSSVLLARGRQMDIVTQAEMIHAFRGLRADLWRSTYAHYVAELLDNFAVEEVPNYPLFALTVRTLEKIADEPELALVTRGFELALLGMMGYRPQLFRCIGCDQPVEPGDNRFSGSRGGVLCAACGSREATATPISDPALKLLRNLQSNEAAVLALRGLDPAVQREAETRLREYIALRLERDSRAVSFLDRLRAEWAPA